MRTSDETPVVEPGRDDDGSPPVEPGARRRSKARILCLIAVAGLAVRVLLVLVAHPICEGQQDVWSSGSDLQWIELFEHLQATKDAEAGCLSLGGDPLSTITQARLIADGNGMSSTVIYLRTAELVPGAARPPAWTLTIVALDLAGATAPDHARLMASLLGALAVVAIGHLAWQLAGRTAGIAAALLTAFNPSLLMNDWHLLNDGPFALVCALILIAAYRFWRSPSAAMAVLLGASIALGFFTRSEAILLLGFLVPPLAFWLPGLDLRRRIALGAIVIATAVSLVAPFMVWNFSRFNNPQPLIGGGVSLHNGSCDDVYFGPRIGMVGFECFDGIDWEDYYPPGQTSIDESDVDQYHGKIARAYVGANIRRVPIVMAARLGRAYGLFRPAQTMAFETDVERRGAYEPWLGLGLFYVLVPFSAAGLVHLRRRRIPISPFVAMGATVTVTIALTYGLPRFRIPVDVAMCVLGGIGIASLIRWHRDARASGASAPRDFWELITAAAGAMGQRMRSRVLGLQPAVRIGAFSVIVVLAMVLVWSATASPVVPAPP